MILHNPHLLFLNHNVLQVSSLGKHLYPPRFWKYFLIHTSNQYCCLLCVLKPMDNVHDSVCNECVISAQYWMWAGALMVEPALKWQKRICNQPNIFTTCSTFGNYSNPNPPCKIPKFTSSCRAVLNNPRHLPLQIALFYMPNSDQFDILWCDCYCWLNQMSIYELTARLPPGYLLPTGFNGPHVFSHLYIRIYPYIYDAMRNESYYIEQGYLQNRFGWFCF